MIFCSTEQKASHVALLREPLVCEMHVTCYSGRLDRSGSGKELPKFDQGVRTCIAGDIRYDREPYLLLQQAQNSLRVRLPNGWHSGLLNDIEF